MADSSHSWASDSDAEAEGNTPADFERWVGCKLRSLSLGGARSVPLSSAAVAEADLVTVDVSKGSAARAELYRLYVGTREKGRYRRQAEALA